MRLSDLRETKDVSILGRAIKKHLDAGHVVWMDFKHTQSTITLPPSDFYGIVRSIKKHDEGYYTINWDMEGRDDDEFWPGNTFDIDSSMDDVLTVEDGGENFMHQKVYKIVNIHPVSEGLDRSKDPEKTLLWKAINAKLKNEDAFIEIDVPYKIWTALSPTFKVSYSARNRRLRARVIGALRGNRINTTDPVLQLHLTPEMDDALEFAKLYSDEEAYIIRPL